MTPGTDPLRTLGLEPGATPAEIKRAYRRLAKAYHPDSAGPLALPRFLAIQAAYERLTDGPAATTRNGRRPAEPRPGAEPSTPPPPGRSWRADAERARATREAHRRRTNRTGPRPSGDPGRPAGGGSAPGRDPASGATGSTGSADPSGRSGRAGGRKGRPKATIGSTSYDGTENEPFEPGWSGATWYGAASGTYWTINPKEYADPRKHGPEYLARARRSQAGGPAGEPTVPPAPATSGGRGDRAGRPEHLPRHRPGLRATTGERRARWPRIPVRRLSRAIGGPPEWMAGTPGEGTLPRRFGGAGPGAVDRVRTQRSPARGSPSRGIRRSHRLPRRCPSVPWLRRPPVGRLRPVRRGPVRQGRPRRRPRPQRASAGPVAAGTAGPPARRSLDLAWIDPSRFVRTWRGRILLAALGWFPIGLAIFGIHGQVTGCSRYLASCTEPVGWSVWIPQLIVFALLLTLRDSPGSPPAPASACCS